MAALIYLNGPVSNLPEPRSVICRSMKVRYDLPDFLRRVLAAERRPGNQIFAHRQAANDNRIETNLSDEGRRDINSLRVVAGDSGPRRVRPAGARSPTGWHS